MRKPSLLEKASRYWTWPEVELDEASTELQEKLRKGWKEERMNKEAEDITTRTVAEKITEVLDEVLEGLVKRSLEETGTEPTPENRLLFLLSEQKHYKDEMCKTLREARLCSYGGRFVRTEGGNLAYINISPKTTKENDND